MSIRLMGLEEECQAAITALKTVFHVVEVSGPYPNRGDSGQVRYFVETRGLRLCAAGSPLGSSFI
jgi:hypothetical protein